MATKQTRTRNPEKLFKVENEELVDSFRYMHPDKTEFTFRTKDGEKRGRLDYGLISPTLIPHLKLVKHTAHHFGVTDHSFLLIIINITKSTKGKGTFRCAPKLHNDPTYQQLIKNTIRKAVFTALTKNDQTLFQEAIFQTRMKLTEELNSIKTKVPNWETTH